MTDRELLAQALEALEWVNTSPWLEDCYHAFDKEVAALRERLAHCDRCGKPLGGPGHIHTCTPKQPVQDHTIDCPRCGHCCPQS